MAGIMPSSANYHLPTTVSFGKPETAYIREDHAIVPTVKPPDQCEEPLKKCARRQMKQSCDIQHNNCKECHDGDKTLQETLEGIRYCVHWKRTVPVLLECFMVVTDAMFVTDGGSY